MDIKHLDLLTENRTRMIRLKSALLMSWAYLKYLWAVWCLLVLVLIYYLWGPFKIRDNVVQATAFVNTLSPRFYVALTGTSSLISGLILIFEWWYFKRYGTSFIEQFSLNYLSPILGGANGNNGVSGNGASDGSLRCSKTNGTNSAGSAGFSAGRRGSLSAYDEDDWGVTGDGDENMGGQSGASGPSSVIQRNPMALFRRAEYERFRYATGREPLTFYDLNLSAQEHQAAFLLPGETDSDSRPDLQLMELAWRERDPPERVNKAHLALEKNPECIQAYLLLAEEEALTMVDAERHLRQALKIAESNFRRPPQVLSSTGMSESVEMAYRRDVTIIFYIKRRLAMCMRRLGRIREAVKMFKELLKDSCFSELAEVFSIHENLVESLLEMQAYADVQALLSRYDSAVSEARSACMCYTTALMRARSVADKFSADIATRRGLTNAEVNVIEAIHRAVEYNPHVAQYLLETKKLILPPEHIIRRGDSEAIAYAFHHLQHWKRVDGALNLLQCTWEGAFRLLPSPLESGYLFYSYPSNIEQTDRELLPMFHDVSVYPKKELPFFILFTAALCSVMALMTLLAHSYPQYTITLSKTIAHWLSSPIAMFFGKLESILPSASSLAFSKFG